MKRCAKCRERLPLSSFCNDSSRPDGLYTYCRTCSSRALRAICPACRQNVPFSRFDIAADRCKSCLMSAGEQRCGRCRELKPLGDFYADRRRRSGRYSWCRQCAKPTTEQAAKWSRKTKYGLTSDDYAKLVTTQAGLCAICRRPERRQRQGRTISLHVDHDHATGKVRGLLCTDCNLGVGRFGDSPKRLRAAAEYLESHGERNPPDRPASRRHAAAGTVPVVRRTKPVLHGHT